MNNDCNNLYYSKNLLQYFSNQVGTSPEKALLALQSAVLIGYLASRKIRHLRGLQEATLLLSGSSLATSLEYLYNQSSEDNPISQENWPCFMGMMAVAYMTYRLLYAITPVEETETPINPHSQVTPVNPCSQVTPASIALAERLIERKTRLRNLSHTDISVSRIALTLGDSFIHRTYLEGGSPIESLEDWGKMIFELNGPDELFPIFLSDKDKQALHDQLKASCLLYGNYMNRLSGQLIEYIHTLLVSHNYCVLPLEYASTGYDSPHVFGCVFTRDSRNRLICYFLNKGEGIEQHPTVNYEGPKVKSSYCSLPLVVDNDILNVASDKSTIFFDNLERFTSSQTPHLPYSTGEMYTFFSWQAGVVDWTALHADFTAVSEQRSGTCSEQLTRLIILDFLLKKSSLSPVQAIRTYKRLILRKKFWALHQAYETFKTDFVDMPHTPRDFLLQLRQEFAVSLNKKYDHEIMTSEEMLSGYSLLSLVDEALKTHATSPVDVSHFPALDFEPRQESNAFRGKTNPSVRQYPGIVFDYDQLPCLSISLENELFRFRFFLCRSDELCIHVLAFLNTLPVPGTSMGDRYWNSIPIADIADIVNSLFLLVEQSNKSLLHIRQSFRGSIYADLLMLNLFALTVMDRLLRRLSHLRLNDFSPGLDFYHLGNQLLFHQGTDQERWSQIKAYWESPMIQSRKNRLCTLITDDARGVIPGGWISKHDLFESMNKVVHFREGIVARARYFSQFCPDQEATAKALCEIDPSKTTSIPREFLRYETLGYQCTQLLKPDFARIDHEQRFTRKIKLRNLMHIIHDDTEDYLEGGASTNHIPNFQLGPISDKALCDLLFGAKPLWENTIVLDQKQNGEREKSISPLLRQMRKILHQDELIIPALFDWLIRSSSALIHSTDVKTFVRACLFKQELYLQNQLRKTPHLRELIQQSLAQILDNNETGIEDSLFWIQIGYLVETHVAVVQGETYDREYVDLLLNRLDALECGVTDHHVGIYALRCYLLGMRLDRPFSRQDVIAFSQSYLLLRYWGTSSLDYWLTQEIHLQWATHVEKIRAAITQDPSLLTELLLPIGKILGIDIKAIQWENIATSNGVYLGVEGQDKYALDILRGLFFLNDEVQAIIGLPSQFHNDPKFRLALGESFNIHSLVTQRKNGEIYWMTPDFQVEVRIEKSSLIIKKEFDWGHGKQFYEFNAPHEAWLDDRIPSSLLRTWTSEVDSKYQFHTIFLDANGAPYAKARTSKLARKHIDDIVKLESDGTETTPLLFLINEGPCLKIKSRLDDFTSWKNVLCWCKGTNQHYKLKNAEFGRIDFFSIGLSFIVDDKKRAICEQFPQYRLDFGKNCSSYDDLEGALRIVHLDNPKDQALLIPNVALKSARFEDTTAFSPQWHQSLEEGSQPFYVYPIEPRTQTLSIESPFAFILLVQVMRANRRYDKALEYISQFQTEQNWEPNKPEKGLRFYEAVLRLFDEKFHLPSDIAINLKLAVVALKKLTSPFDSPPPLFIEAVANTLDRYYQLLSSVPVSLRLSQKEERMLLQVLNGKTAGHHLALNRVYTLATPNPAGDSSPPCRAKATYTLRKSTLLQTLQEPCPFLIYKNYFMQMHAEHTGRQANHLLRTQRLGDLVYSQFLYFLKDSIRQSEGSQIDYDLFHMCSYQMEKGGIDSQSLHSALLALLYGIRRAKNKAPFEQLFMTHRRNPEQIAEMLAKMRVEVSRQQAQELLSETKSIALPPLAQRRSNKPQAAPSVPLFEKMMRQISPPLFVQTEECAAQFLSKPLPIRDDPFALNHIAVTDPLAADLLSRLKKGHHSTEGLTYSLKETSSLESLVQKLEEKQTELENILQILQQKTMQLANAPTEADLKNYSLEQQMTFIQRQRAIFAGTVDELTVDDLYTAYLFGDLTPLVQNNPFLSDEKACTVLFQSFIELVTARSTLDQIEAALQEARKAPMQGRKGDEDALILAEVGALLHRKREFDPLAYPLFLAYEYATGLLLRPDQIPLLHRIFALPLSQSNAWDNIANRLFFEFRAGGGKTDVLATLLAIKAIREGLCPLFISLPETHDITKGIFRSSIARVVRRHVDPLEVKLNTHPSLSELQKISKQLKEGFKDKKCFIMTPETYHALNLEYQKALEEKHRAKVAILGKILDFFHFKCLFLVDEAHINVQSILQANTAYGTPVPLPEIERAHFEQCIRLLSGLPPFENVRIKDGRLLKELVRLRENKQAVLNDANDKEMIFDTVQQELLKSIGLTLEQIHSLRPFMMNRAQPAPSFLIEWNQSSDIDKKNKAKLIALTRGLVLEILNHTLSLSCYADYGQSIHLGDLIEAPKKRTRDTTAHFENPDVASTLTCQGKYQRGIDNIDEMRMIVEGYQTVYQVALLSGQSREQIPEYQQFLRWQSAYSGREISLDEDFSSNEIVKELIRRIGKEPELIRTHLINTVLPSLTIFPQKMTSTASDLAYGCRAAIFFSATLGLKELYPYVDDQDKFIVDDTFQARVIQRACEPQNSEIYSLSQQNPQEFFEAIDRENPAAFEEIDGIIDTGAWSKESTSEEWARAFLRFLREVKNRTWNYAGVLFFQEINGVKQRYFLSSLEAQPVLIKTKNLAQELAALGYKDQRAFTILGPQETTGVDLIFPNKTKFLVTLGETTDLSTIVQGIMRLRGFLRSESMQTIAWVVPSLLKEEIQKVTGAPTLVSSTCFHWSLLQEAKTQKKSIIMRAIQEIEGAYRAYARQCIRSQKAKKSNPKGKINYRKAEKQIQEFEHYKPWFVFGMERDTFALYASTLNPEKTEHALKTIALEFAGKVKLPLTPETAALEKRVATIIEQTKRLIDAIDLREGTLSSEQMQEQNRIQEKQHQGINDQTEDAPKTHSLYASRLLDVLLQGNSHRGAGRSKYITQANKLLKTTLFSPDFFIMKNVYKTSVRKRMKPIEHVLVIEEKGVKTAYAVSYFDALSYKQQLLSLDPRRYVNKAALFTAGGLLVINGPGNAGLEGDLLHFAEDPWFKTITRDIALYNARITDHPHAAALMTRHPQEMKALWDHITCYQIEVDAKSHAFIMHLINSNKQLAISKEETSLAGVKKLAPHRYADEEDNAEEKPWQEPPIENIQFLPIANKNALLLATEVAAGLLGKLGLASARI